MMVKFVSIAASFLILIQSFNICIRDFVDLSEFIEHAKFHSEKYGDNLFVFISKHYGELEADHNKKHQEEKQEHEELPFQHQSHMTVLSAFVIKDLQAYQLKPVDDLLTPKANFFYRASYSNFEKEGPFQPPRAV
ncbi:MAG: hypothetical protein JSV59_07295 [Flavobacteriaceae bacterium]|nr:MAG: hypothetical protein JSV59_07295 [Flavobacteriaceae bacterium]